MTVRGHARVDSSEGAPDVRTPDGRRRGRASAGPRPTAAPSRSRGRRAAGLRWVLRRGRAVDPAADGTASRRCPRRSCATRPGPSRGPAGRERSRLASVSAKHGHGSSASYFSPAVQVVVEQGFGCAGRPFRHRHSRDARRARAPACARRAAVHGRLRCPGRALHWPDQRAGLPRLRGRGVRPPARNLRRRTTRRTVTEQRRRPRRMTTAALPARLSDIGVVLEAPEDSSRRRGRARRWDLRALQRRRGRGRGDGRHPQIQAGVNLDGFIPAPLS